MTTEEKLRQENRALRDLLRDVLTVIAEEPDCQAGDLQYRVNQLVDSAEIAA